MGLLDFNKAPEQKIEKALNKAVESINLQPKDGLIHAGAFEIGIVGQQKVSIILDGVLGYLQRSDREIVDVKLHTGGIGDNVRSLSAVVLYK